MCGNGLRCVVKELYDRGGLAQPELAIETGAGRLACAIDAERRRGALGDGRDGRAAARCAARSR